MPTTCEYKTSMDSSYVFGNSSNSAYEFDMRVTFRFIVRSIIGLYSYDVNSREFTLLGETSNNSTVLNGKFNSTKILYVNFYLTSTSRGCAGMNFYVTGPENITVIEPIPEPEPEEPEPEEPEPEEPEPEEEEPGVNPSTGPVVQSAIDDTIYTTESTGSSKGLSAGIIIGIVIGGIILISLTLVLSLFFKKIMSAVTKSIEKLGKKIFKKSATDKTLDDLNNEKNNVSEQNQEYEDDVATNQVDPPDQEALENDRPIQISAIVVQTKQN